MSSLGISRNTLTCVPSPSRPSYNYRTCTTAVISCSYVQDIQVLLRRDTNSKSSRQKGTRNRAVKQRMFEKLIIVRLVQVGIQAIDFTEESTTTTTTVKTLVETLEKSLEKIGGFKC